MRYQDLPKVRSLLPASLEDHHLVGEHEKTDAQDSEANAVCEPTFLPLQILINSDVQTTNDLQHDHEGLKASV